MEKLRSEVKIEDTWDLSYLVKDKKDLEQKLKEFEKSYKKVLSLKGKILDSNESLLEFFSAYLEFNKLEETLYVYTYQKLDEDTTNSENSKLYAEVTKLIDEYSSDLSFITPELMKTPYSDVLKIIEKDERLKIYKFDLERTYRNQKHILSEKEEKVISIANEAFGSTSEAYKALANTDIDFGYIKDEKGNDIKLTSSNFIKFQNSKNREVRKESFYKVYKYWEDRKNTVSELYKGCIKEGFFNSKVRKFSTPLEQSLFSDNISVELYKKLIDVTHKNLNKMYEYVKLRKKMLGVDELHFYDIYVDLIEEKEQNISFEEAKKIVFNALKPLGKEYLKDLEKAFSERWIDKYPNKGKKSGAYKFGTYYSKPYVLLNFEGDRDSVSTIAHELGHAMHSYYSNKTQDYIYHDYPIFLAEIASTVNEVLLNDYLIKNAKDKKEKILYITDFLEKIKSTIYRQTMFAEFESIMHDKYKKGIGLTCKEFTDTYYELNKQYFGDDMFVDKEISYEFMRVPHFFTPFYVYKYATGLSIALCIASEILNGNENMLKKYKKFLSAGGSDYPINILEYCGIDIINGDVIQKAFDMFESRINELKELTKED